jgi:hypothetical protein
LKVPNSLKMVVGVFGLKNIAEKKVQKVQRINILTHRSRPNESGYFKHAKYRESDYLIKEDYRRL